MTKFISHCWQANCNVVSVLVSTVFMYLYITINRANSWRKKERALWWSWVVWLLLFNIFLTLWAIRDLFEALEGLVMIKFPNFYVLKSGKCGKTRSEFSDSTPAYDEVRLQP